MKLKNNEKVGLKESEYKENQNLNTQSLWEHMSNKGYIPVRSFFNFVLMRQRQQE